MSSQPIEFNRGVIRPVECIKEGWETIKPDYWLMVAICLVGIIVGSVVPLGILMGPMMCGIHLCMFARARGETPEFGLLFKGFDFFAQSLIATLIQVVPMLVVIVPVYIVFIVVMGVGFGAMASANNGAPPPQMFALIIVAYLVLILAILITSVAIGLSFIFSYQLIIDRGLSGVDACKTSARAVWANLGGALSMVLLFVLLGIVGVMACYIGAILMLPIHFAAMDVAYRRVFPGGPAAASPYAAPQPPQYPNYGDRFQGQ